ncbi:hypothetical protein [Porphyrobacter sp. AAP60]|uniref:hypothetical protein n=1 Tax=Porphyrobacter sp. AAP60 TaxID=1523423 RepID=UPI0006B9ED63|nr:hypothetical protein [Porphyrobacter sp. AAP60]KPF63280.1 hypothetical protein IP79_10350 [Porphyrobacter sp. AAP60]
MKAPRQIIAYRPEALAPHQGLLVDFMKQQLPSATRIIERTIPTGRLARLLFAVRVALDALLFRRAVLYFASFVSVVYATIPLWLGHRRYIYHSQDWIADLESLPARLEKRVVKRAPVVIWNEAARAARAKELAGRSDEILVLPTYLPAAHEVPKRCEDIRNQIAELAGASVEDMVIVFAGGGYSVGRLSAQFVEAAVELDRNIVAVFTGATKLPPDCAAPNMIDMGLLPFDRMLAVMASCDIGLLLYDYADSFGHTNQQPGRLTEYLKGGLALIATPFGDARRLASDTAFCTVVEGYDVTELRQVLKHISEQIRSGGISRNEIRNYVASHMAYEPFAIRTLQAAFEELV